jgi:hypothetical protein
MANEAKERLVAGLNDDLALELAGIVRSVYQASTAGGLLGRELRELLQGVACRTAARPIPCGQNSYPRQDTYSLNRGVPLPSMSER